MARILTEEEKEKYLENREELHEQLVILRNDLEDFDDEDLVNCRRTILTRINRCLEAILATDEDDLS